MLKRSLIIICVLMSMIVSSQTSNEQKFNYFPARTYMKFNRFLTNPTFSVLNEDKSSVSAIVRNSFVKFEDSPRLYLGSYSGIMKDNLGVGFAVFQQEVGVFKDFGAVANFSQKMQVGYTSDLTFGLNLMYSRRSADGRKVNSNDSEPLISNYQDIPIVNLQPAISFSFKNFTVGLFFENLVDFNLKKNETVTSFGDKTIAANLMYKYPFNQSVGIFEFSELRFLGIGRKQPEGFGYAANAILDLPKLGWIRAGYDNFYGMSAGVGVNLSENLSMGFSYERSNFGNTTEIGIIYSFSNTKKRRRVYVKPKKKKEKLQPKEEQRPVIIKEQQPVKDLSDELQRAQDSINELNRKVDEVLKLLKNRPQPQQVIIKEEKVKEEPKLKVRRNYKPWRRRPTSGGGGGTMFYVVADRFKDIDNANSFINFLANKSIESKVVKDAESDNYYVYVDRFAREEDAKEFTKEFNEGGRRLVTNKDSDSSIDSKVKNTYKEPVYVAKITTGQSNSKASEEVKPQGKPAISVLNKTGNLKVGYYLVANVFSKKPFAERFVQELRNDNINANYFVNPKNGYMYVYLAKVNTRQEALNLYYNNLKNSYYDKKSIYIIR